MGRNDVTRIGLVGYGQIGAAVHDLINANPDTGMEVVFIHDQDSGRLADVESAQQRIVDVVRRLEDAGEIVIAGRGEKEMIV